MADDGQPKQQGSSMRNMKHVALAAIVALAAGAAGAQEKDWSKIRIGTEGAYPPFNVLESNGELTGFDIDIARALCEKMQAECEFVTQDWDGMIPALQAGKYDAIIASMSITPERAEQVAFSNKYYDTPPALVVPKDSDITSVEPAAVAGKTIGAQSSTTHSRYVEQFYGDAELKMYPTSEEYKLDLRSGRLDGAVDDIIVLSEWVNSPEGACCKIVGPIESVPEIHGQGSGIAIRKEDTALVEKFNKAIEDIRADGTYEEINNKYFDFDVYGG